MHFIHFFFFFYLFIRHIDIYMFPMINFLKNLQRKTGVQFLLILDVNGELTEQKQYLLGGVLTVIL